MSRAGQRFAQHARNAALDLELLEFPEGTHTAQDAARAVGSDLAQIAKSVVFMADASVVLVLVSGARQADEHQLAALTEAQHVRIARPGEAQQATGYPIGGTQPFGLANVLQTYLDQSLLHHPQVWAAAGTPQSVFTRSPHPLHGATGATVAQV